MTNSNTLNFIYRVFFAIFFGPVAITWEIFVRRGKWKPKEWQANISLNLGFFSTILGVALAVALGWTWVLVFIGIQAISTVSLYVVDVRLNDLKDTTKFILKGSYGIIVGVVVITSPIMTSIVGFLS